MRAVTVADVVSQRRRVGTPRSEWYYQGFEAGLRHAVDRKAHPYKSPGLAEGSAQLDAWFSGRDHGIAAIQYELLCNDAEVVLVLPAADRDHGDEAEAMERR